MSDVFIPFDSEAPITVADATMTMTSVFDHPAFPFTIAMPGSGASVTLKADGTWQGDLTAFRDAVAKMKGNFGDSALLVWLVLRQMEQDVRRW